VSHTVVEIHHEEGDTERRTSGDADVPFTEAVCAMLRLMRLRGWSSVTVRTED
jgi:hypothetical protein